MTQENNNTNQELKTETHAVVNATAESHEEVSHEATLYAEPIYHIGNFTVTNALFTSWIVVILILIIGIAVRLKLKKIPKGIQNLFEIIIDGALSLCDQVTQSRIITNKAFPIVFSVFFIVLLNNWL